MSKNQALLNSPPPKVLPDADFLLHGEFVRTGDHLLIQKETGERVLLEDYFTQSARPALQAPNGALLQAETVELLTRPDKPATLVAGPSMYAEPAPTIGTSTKLVGHVTATGPDGVSRTLQEGSPVHPRDVIKTDKGASVLFRFVDGTEFQLSNQAQAVLDKYQFDPAEKQGAFEATVTRGIFRYQSGDLAFQHPGQHSLIKTPTAMIGVRGSELSGEVAEDGSTTVVHTSGILDISDAAGRETVTLLEPGTATSVTFGAAAPTPIFRPPAPFLNHLKNNLDFDMIRDHGGDGRKDDGNKSHDKGAGSDGVNPSDKSHAADGKSEHAADGAGLDKTASGQTQHGATGEGIKDPLLAKDKELSSLSTGDLFLTSQGWTASAEGDSHGDKGNGYAGWMAATAQQDEIYRPRLITLDTQNSSETVLPPALPSKTGVFLDSPVGGVTYTAGNVTGITTSSGGYAYKPGDIVVFRIGDIVLGSSQGQNYVTPVDLAPAKSSNAIVNILRLLQTLDSDGNPNNGIQISEQAQEAAKGVTVDINASIEEFGSNNQLISLVSNPDLFDPGLPPKEGLLSAVEAMAHFKSTLQELADLEEGQLSGLLEVLDEVDGALVASASELKHDALQVAEDASFAFTIQDLLANDRITGTTSLDLVRIVQPTHGKIELSADGGMSYTAPADFHGIDTFSYTMPDGIGGMATATVQIDVTSVNDAPTAANKVLNLVEDGRLTLQVSDFGFADLDGDALAAVTITNLSGHGTLWLDTDQDDSLDAGEALVQGGTVTAAQIGNGQLHFSPVDNGSGTGYAGIGFTVSDGELSSTATTLNVDVTPVNDAPDAVDDTTLATHEDASLTFAASDLLGNDTDPDTDALTISAYGAPEHGVLVVNEDHTLTYTPNADYHGADGWSYTIQDGHGGSDTATVRITIAAVNDAPDAVDDTTLATHEDASLTFAASDLLGNDTDPDTDALTISAYGAPEHGVLVVNEDHTLTYTPNADYHGADGWSYTIQDGHGGSDTATVRIAIAAVNDAPDAVDDTTLATHEDASLTFAASDLLGNDTDLDTDALTISAYGAPEHGVLVVNEDHTLTYTPNADYHGADGWSYTIQDGHGGSDTATVRITIAAVNDAPDAVDDTTLATHEDASLTFAASDLLGNDTDLDTDALTISAYGAPEHGSLVVNEDHTLTYTPNADYHGADGWSYTIQDGHGGSDTATVRITIAAVNDAPDAVDDTTLATHEDASLTFAASDLLGNDTDPDTDALTISAYGAPEHGVLVVNEDHTLTYTPNADYHGADGWSYTIQDGHGGSDTATVRITIAAVNDAPDAVDDTTLATHEDASLTFAASDLLGNDTDPDTDALTISAYGAPEHGSLVVNEDHTLTYTPNADYHGADGWSYTIQDGHGGSDTATVRITIAAVNDAPDAVDDTTLATHEDASLTFAASDLLGNDTDLDTDALTISAYGAPEHGVLVVNEDHTLTYTPNADYHGADGWSYTIQDGHGGSDTATVRITIAAVNDAPDAANKTLSLAEDGRLTLQTSDFGFADIDGDALVSVTLTSLSGHGTLWLDGDQDGSLDAGEALSQGATVTAARIAGNELIFSPVADAMGTNYAAIGFSVSDGALSSAVHTLSMDVTAVNDAPTATNKSLSLVEDGRLTLQASDFGFADIDGDALVSVTLTALPGAGSLWLDADQDGSLDAGEALSEGATVTAAQITSGQLLFAPVANASGTGYAGIGFTVSDGGLSSVPATLSVDVTAVNDAPTAANKSLSLAEDGRLTLQASDFGFADIDGDALASVTLTALPGAGSLWLDADQDGTLDAGEALSEGTAVTAAQITSGQLLFAPVANASGTGYAGIGFTVSDGGLSSVPATLSVDVTAVNDAPIATNKSLSLVEDGRLTLQASDFGFADIDGDALVSVTLTALPGAGSLWLDADQDGSLDAGEALSEGTAVTAAQITSGQLLFAPVANASGTGYAGIGFTVSDGGLSSVPATLSVDVTAVNDAPTAANKSLSLAEDGRLTLQASDFGFADIDGDALASVTLTALPGAGSLWLDADQDGSLDAGEALSQGATVTAAQITSGQLLFAPVANASGTGYAGIGFTVSDGGLSSVPATLSVDVTAVNDAPTAANKSLSLVEDGRLTLQASDFGFADIDGDALVSVTLTALPGAGSLWLDADQDGTLDAGEALSQGAVVTAVQIAGGQMFYSPVANASGSGYASIGFSVSDGGLSSVSATLAVNVTAVNDAPTAENKSLTMDEDALLTLKIMDFGFGDVDGDAMASVTVTTLTGAGTLWLDADGDGVLDAGEGLSQGATVTVEQIKSNHLIFSPVDNESGTNYATIGFSVSDGARSSDSRTLTVDVTPVNDAPTAANTTLTTLEDLPLILQTSDFSFSGVDGNSLSSVTIGNLSGKGTLWRDADGDKILDSGEALTQGSIVTAAQITAGQLIFSPEANGSGRGYAGIVFTVSDGELSSDPSTLTVNVTAVNDAPTAANKTLSLAEDGRLTLQASDFGFADIDGDALASVTLTTLPGAGSLWLDADQDGSLDAGEALSQGATVTAAQITSGQLLFAPVANASGARYAAIGFSVSDGALSSDSRTLSLDVTAVNDTPTAANKSLTVAEDGRLTLQASDFGFADIDGDVLASVTITSLSGKGTPWLDADGDGSLDANEALSLGATVTAAQIAGGRFFFTPVANESGTNYAAIGFTASDGALSSAARTLSVDVTAVNDAPTAANKTLTVAEDGRLTVQSGDFGFADVDGGDTLASVTLTTLPEKGFLWRDADGDGVVDAGERLSQGATITVAQLRSGQLNYAPVANASGSGYAAIGFTVSDGKLSSAAGTLTVDVTAVNDAPTAANKTLTMDEDGRLTLQSGDFGFADIDGDPLASVTLTTLPGRGTLWRDADGDGVLDSNESLSQGATITAAQIAGGQLNYAPVANASGSGYAAIGFTVSDGKLSSAPGILTVDVRAVNDAPNAVDDGSLTTREDTAFNFATSVLLGNDTDPDSGDTLSITGYGTPGHGTLVVNANGTLTYTPTGNFNGTDQWSYTISDGHGGTDTATARIVVTAVNDAVEVPVSVPVNGLLAHYAFDGNLNDGSGQGLNASAKGSLIYSTGHAGQSLYTASGYALTPTLSSITNNTGFAGVTLSAWFKLSSTGTNQILEAHTTNDELYIEGSASSMTFKVNTIALSAPISSANTWHQIVGTFDNASNLQALYVDGTLVTSTSNTVNFAITTPFTIGRDYEQNIQNFNGYLDDVRIYGRALNDTEVRSLYNEQYQEVSTHKNTATTITLGSDPDGDALTSTILTAPSHGTLSGSGAQRIYTPANNWLGSDYFAYSLSDGTTTKSAGVKIVVDPLVLDLNGDGIHLTVSEAGSSAFAMSPDGSLSRAGWIDGADGFLVRDLNGNGRIDDITEMFSEFYAGSRHASGMDALATLDGNHDGQVDRTDSGFESLSVWRDGNGDGQTDAGELTSLDAWNLTAISLEKALVGVNDAGGQVLSHGRAETAEGGGMLLAEVALTVDNHSLENGAFSPSSQEPMARDPAHASLDHARPDAWNPESFLGNLVASDAPIVRLHALDTHEALPDTHPWMESGISPLWTGGGANVLPALFDQGGDAGREHAWIVAHEALQPSDPFIHPDPAVHFSALGG
ncbi:hypothetical protein SIID45300_02141 [Candidatus Magnetaquicoccaceae bacterium FCR-1]|uniref:LamG-like jellyroll fold domain-containing protein n=1 Tax=Candidatus Magnetaquiglobus chichijimensis TaxID=3141448 RepID=A0ABQ0CA89_9PROT